MYIFSEILPTVPSVQILKANKNKKLEVLRNSMKISFRDYQGAPWVF